MSRLNERPIIFCDFKSDRQKRSARPSRPTRGRRARRCLQPVCSFPDVAMNGTTFHPGQAKHFYIFPAVGLAIYVARPRRITECFIVATEATADQVGPDLRAKGMLFPSQADILETEVMTANARSPSSCSTKIWPRSSDRGTSARGSRASSTNRSTDACAGRPPTAALILAGAQAHSLDSSRRRAVISDGPP